MPKISVTRALTEIKTLDEQINVAIANTKLVYTTKGEGAQLVVNGTTQQPEALKEAVSSAFQSLKDKIARRTALKALVAASNQKTLVNINGIEMTVATAIDMKNAMPYHTNLYNQVRNQYGRAVIEVEQANARLDSQIETAVQQAYGNDKGKVTPEQYEAVAAPRKAQHKAAVLTAFDVDKWLAEQQDKINDFMMEVDFVLSESNARTEIEI